MRDPLAALRRVSLRTGVKIPISLSALTAGTMVQYDRDSATLRSHNRKYGGFNKVYIQNNSDETIVFEPDYISTKRITCISKSGMEVTDLTFAEFNVYNTSATDTSDGEVIITVMYERPLAREG